VSPVLKPADLSDRSFFLADNRYLLRLGPGQPNLRWKLDRPARGRLKVSFYAYADKKANLPPFRFVVTASGSGGPEKTLVRETLGERPSGTLESHYDVEVSLPAGAEIEFGASTESDGAGAGAAMDAGITVPRIVTASTAPSPSPLLIISIDALRSDYLGVYRTLSGHRPDRSFSPELDRFAENAVVFRNARTVEAATWPALSALHLSKYPYEHGVTQNRTYLETAGRSIGTLMRGLGFDTFSITANAYPLNIPGFEEKHHFFKDDAKILDFARKRLSEPADAPFFHWYHLWGCHDNYAPPEWVMKIIEQKNPGYLYRRYKTNDMMLGREPCGPEDIAAVRRLYGGALYYVDSLLKKFFDDIKQRGSWDETLIIVTADHGEELYDHHKFFYHSPSLYDSALRIPLLVKFPHQRGKRVVDENVSLIDILPTIHHYYSGPPDSGRFSGLSLLELLNGRRERFRERVLYAEADDSKIAAAVKGEYKLIYNPSGTVSYTHVGLPFPFEKMEFYDLRRDLGETRNLAGRNHPVLRQLLSEADRFLHAAATRQREGNKGKIELNEEQKKKADEDLRSLGYIR
jgi:arylsulfatase A-like enzyme